MNLIKNKKIRNNSGLTLTMLAIMVVVISIIAGITVTSGMESLNAAEFQGLIVRLEYMQTKVNDLNISYIKNSPVYMNGMEFVGEEILNIGEEIDGYAVIELIFDEEENLGSGILESTGFRYYTVNILESLGISSDGHEYLINIETRTVIDVDGIKYKDKIYYTIAQMESSMYNIEYDTIISIPTFNVQIIQSNGVSTVQLYDVQYEGNINRWYIEYNMLDDSKVIEANNLKFDVTKSGIYEVYIYNGNIKSEVMQIEVSVISEEDKGNTVQELVDSGVIEVGDFINYDAGIWTNEEITEIGANGTTSLPTTSYSFGGYTLEQSRNTRATIYSSYFDYVQVDTDGDDTGDDAISGWRVFDITNGVLTLISAGNPEDYFHPNATDSAYISEYILTGSASNNTDYAGSYEIRDWSMYENAYAIDDTARALTKTELDNWYTKYMETTVEYANEFSYIYDETTEYNKYQTLVDNHSFYWFGLAYDSSFFCNFDPYNRLTNSNYGYSYGIRILLSLKSDIQLVLDEENDIKVMNYRYTLEEDDENYGPKSWQYTSWNIVN